MSAVETVQDIYAAFGRGDVPAILTRLADDVQWEYATAANPIPWLQPLTGRDQVPRFFEALASHVDPAAFVIVMPAREVLGRGFQPLRPTKN